MWTNWVIPVLLALTTPLLPLIGEEEVAYTEEPALVEETVPAEEPSLLDGDPSEVVESISEALEKVEPEVFEPLLEPMSADQLEDGVVDVYVVPITEAINKPNLYILRRALKDAIANDVDMLLLDMDTPGGRVDITIEMMEMLAKFDGITATFVNDNAISAGSFITAATQEIYFSPTGKIGASAVIMGGGQDVPETARLKIESYLRANIRAITEKYPLRSEVIRAMLDQEYELVVNEEVIKPAGELLTLTASEAVRTYGDPATPLLGEAIYENIEELLDARFGEGKYVIRDFSITYSENVAKWMNTFAPALLGIGMLMLFFEFKTPGFGLFGIGGIILIAIFFISQHIAGLAGNEAILFFALGVILVLLELFFFPGTFFAALTGLALMFGSIFWAMIDFWPGETIKLSADLLAEPFVNLVFGLSIAVVGAFVFGRFFKHTWFAHQMVLESAIGRIDTPLVSEESGSAVKTPDLGSEGVAVSDLHPGGCVEIDGERYEARSVLGTIDRSAKIRVLERKDFSLIVEEVQG